MTVTVAIESESDRSFFVIQMSLGVEVSGALASPTVDFLNKNGYESESEEDCVCG